MWCRVCKQDVPAIAATDDAGGDVTCARCGVVLSAPDGDRAASDSAASDSAASDSVPRNSVHPAHAVVSGDRREDAAWRDGKRASQGQPRPATVSLLGLEDWGLKADLERVDQLLREHDAALGGQRSMSVAAMRSDGVNELGGASNAEGRESVGGEGMAVAVTAAGGGRQQMSWFVWLLVCGGMMAMVFGMVLCGWSLGTAREDLWRTGLPALLGGQAALLLGFVFQLDGLWRNQHLTRGVLAELGARLSRGEEPRAWDGVPDKRDAAGAGHAEVPVGEQRTRRDTAHV